MTRRAWITVLAAAVVGIPISMLLAEPGTVKTRDGATYQGDVKDRGQNIVITIHGVDTVIPKSNVASIERASSYAADFHARMAKLAPNDAAGRIALAREAFDRREYDLSREALESALAADPGNPDATSLLATVQSQIRMERAKAQNPPAGSEPPAPEAGAPSRQPAGGQVAIDRRLLTSADIEAIRRGELQGTDTAVRIRFDGDVKKRFAENQKLPFAEFNAQPPVEQALAILSKGDDSMKSKVHILSDPQSLLDFRRQIQPLVLQNCATSGCHGGAPGGGLVLFSPADSDAVTYTNFYILQSYAKKAPGGTGAGGSVFGGSEKRMIDRGHGDQSLLANYGLPTNIAEYPHPMVNNKQITPIFRNKDDARYKMVVDWMDKELLQIAPDYGIHYTPPSNLTTTPPASQPAEATPGK